MEKKITKERNFGLDLIRAIAIVFVLVHHWCAINLSNIDAFKDNIFYMSLFGYLGVEIFFVLSGFLIGNILIKSYYNEKEFGKNQITTFWARRWLRTLPLYYVIFLVHILILVLKNKMISGLWKYPLFLQNIFEYNTKNNDFYGVSWSLSVEEWFYLSFPVILYAFNLLIGKIVPKKKVILSVIFFYIVGSLLVRITYVNLFDPSWNNVLRKAVVCREDSIAFGVLGAYIQNFHTSLFKNAKVKLFLVGLTLFTFCSAIFLNDIAYNYYYSSGEVSFFSKTLIFSILSLSVLLMLPNMYSIKTSNKVISNSVFHISKISYSLYLIHLFVDHITQKIFVDLHDSSILLIKFFIFITFSILISTLSFNLIEKPFFKIRDKIWKEKYSAN